MVRAGSRTSSPRVAMRAYPAKAKNSRPPACSTPATPPENPMSSRPASAAPDDRHTTTTEARTARTTATIARVSQADFWMPP